MDHLRTLLKLREPQCYQPGTGEVTSESFDQESILGSIGIWTGFVFSEERERVKGTVEGDLKHHYREGKKQASAQHASLYGPDAVRIWP